MAWYIWALINLIGSLVIPAFVNFFKTLSLFEDFTLGAFVFLLLNGVEQLEIIAKISELRTKEHRAWLEHDEFEKLLASIQSDYKNLRLEADGPGGALVRLFISQRLKKLRDEVHVAAESKELYVENNHAIDAVRVTDLFREKNETQFCEVFNITDGDNVFEIYGGNYFRQIYDLVGSRHIERVRILLVVDNSSPAAIEKASRLFSFFTNTPYYDARVISKADFEQVHLDSELEQFEDFGIYGGALLFQTVGYNPVNRGKYSCDALKIGKYQSFFDTCWNLPPRLTLPAINPAPTVDETVML